MRSQPSRLVCVAIVASAFNVPASTHGQTPAVVAGRGAISGRVVDESGDPVIRARVVVEVRTGPNATRTVAAAEADDRGEYRVGRLPDGSYLVAVLSVDAVFITPEAIVFGSASGPPKKLYYPRARDNSVGMELRGGSEAANSDTHGHWRAR